MSEAADLYREKRVHPAAKSSPEAMAELVEKLRAKKRRKLPLAEKIFRINRTNAFPQSFGKELSEEEKKKGEQEKIAVYRIGNYRFITHPVQDNPDGTRTYTIERRSPNQEILTAVEITRHPDYPRDIAPIISFRGEIKGEKGKTWGNVSGKDAEPYLIEFLASMTPPKDNK